MYWIMIGLGVGAFAVLLFVACVIGLYVELDRENERRAQAERKAFSFPADG